MARRYERAPELPFGNVWNRIYYIAGGLTKWGIARDGSGWWYLCNRRLIRTEEDIGPFDTFEAAAACFETLVGVDHNDNTLG